MKKLLLPLSLLLFAVSSFAQIGDPLGAAGGPPPANQQLVKLTGSVSERNGDTVKGVLTAVIESGWHINSNKPLEEFALPTVLSFDAKTAELVEAKFPPHVVRSFAFSGDMKVAVFEGTIQIPFTAKLKGDPKTITATLRYQACNDSVCLPPRTVTADVSVPGVAAGASPAEAGRPRAAAPTPGTGFTPLSQAPKNARIVTGTDTLSTTFASHGLPLTLLVLFVLGMALNLTPCVFPMIPITLGFFAMQSDGRRSRRLALSLCYVAGLVVMYSSLGVLAALGGKLFGAWLQLPAVLIGFAILMLILASSMFGAFDIGVPRFVANRAQGRAGLAGATTMGLLVGIIAAPCVGPVVVSLITLVAQLGSPFMGFVMFAALALGLGFPYLALLNALPRPGEWMLQVKKAMGFILVAMAIYFLRSLIGEELFRWGVAASLLIGALFLFLRRGASPAGGRAMRLACGILLLVAGAAFAIPRPNNGGTALRWDRYDASAITAASAQHKPVIIDFYADWCIPCKEFDDVTFHDPAVARELDRFVRVKADLTASDDPKVQELTKKYAVVGVPTIILLDSSGHEMTDLRLTGFEKPEAFLARAKKVQ